MFVVYILRLTIIISWNNYLIHNKIGHHEWIEISLNNTLSKKKKKKKSLIIWK